MKCRGALAQPLGRLGSGPSLRIIPICHPCTLLATSTRLRNLTTATGEVQVRKHPAATLSSVQPDAQMIFKGLGLNAISLAALAEQGLETPTVIQAPAIPVLLKGKSAIICAETGSGKTLAYALPIAERLASYEAKIGTRSAKGKPRSCVLVPTRELALQVGGEFKKLSHHFKFAVRSVVSHKGPDTLSVPVDVVVSSPRTLMDLISRKFLGARDIISLVIDEADTMLNPNAGFLDDVTAFAMACPPSAQVILSGATLHQKRLVGENWLKKIGRTEFDIIETTGVGKLPEQVKVDVEVAQEYDKHPLLLNVVKDSLARRHSTRVIVFCNSVLSCRSTAHVLAEHFGEQCAVICMHGDMLPKQRQDAWRQFSQGPAPSIAVCTDVFARGMDFPKLEHVVLFDVPRHVDDFLHRAGRTARGGKPGRVTLLAGRGQTDEVKALLNAAHQVSW